MKGTIASVGIGVATIFGAVDASVLNETPLERVETIKNERVEVKQVGNIVETAMPWKGEPGIKIKVDMGEPTLTERLADKRKMEVVTEVLNDQMKIDFLLNEKPDTNVFCQTIEGAEDYDFFYQPPLTEEEIAEGAERPEDIVGSYAVYHKTLKNHRVGGINYETGKAWHIYRPQVWSLSSSSTKEWADLSYDEGQLCVTVPQEWLEKAAYPVRVDPTIGFTSVGVSGTFQIARNASDRSTRTSGEIITMPEDGTLDSISVSMAYEFAGSDTVDTSVFINIKDGSGANSHTQFIKVEETNLSITGTAQSWYDFTAASQVLTSSALYIINVVGDGADLATANADLLVPYDLTGGSNDYYSETGTANYAAISTESPWTASPSSGLRTSIYATYTAAAGAAAPAQQSELWF